MAMRGLVILLIVLAVIGSFVGANISSKATQNTKQQKTTQFNTFTSAVCNNDGKITKCKDELFVNCNGKILKFDEIAECNGLKLDVQKPTGSAVFSKEWKDPRTSLN